jgi:hypothetical protein
LSDSPPADATGGLKIQPLTKWPIYIIHSFLYICFHIIDVFLYILIYIPFSALQLVNTICGLKIQPLTKWPIYILILHISHIHICMYISITSFTYPYIYIYILVHWRYNLWQNDRHTSYTYTHDNRIYCKLSFFHIIDIFIYLHTTVCFIIGKHYLWT